MLLDAAAAPLARPAAVAAAIAGPASVVRLAAPSRLLPIAAASGSERPPRLRLAAIAAAAVAVASSSRRRAPRTARRGYEDSGAEAKSLKKALGQRRRSWLGIRFGALEEDLREAVERERRISSELEAKIEERSADIRVSVDALSTELSALKNRELALSARLRKIEGGSSEGEAVVAVARGDEAAAARNFDEGEGEGEGEREWSDADEKWATVIDEQNQTLEKVLGVIQRIEEHSVAPIFADEQLQDELDEVAAAPSASDDSDAPRAHSAAQEGEAQEGEQQPAPPRRQQPRDAKDLVMKGYRNAWGR